VVGLGIDQDALVIGEVQHEGPSSSDTRRPNVWP
jgi:hypothetical protein